MAESSLGALAKLVSGGAGRDTRGSGGGDGEGVAKDKSAFALRFAATSLLVLFALVCVVCTRVRVYVCICVRMEQGSGRSATEGIVNRHKCKAGRRQKCQAVRGHIPIIGVIGMRQIRLR